MPTLEKNNNRPFGQSTYNKDLLKPTFNDYHHKFILLIPTKERTIGVHVRYEVYSQRNKTAIEYFTELQLHLYERSREIGAKQEIIVVEQTEVTLIDKPTYSVDFLKVLLRELEGKY